ncbi:hypothetical protein M3O75_10765 [Klebsiella pneumoniae]|nr:hypothetical protein [Klebsiella pneumoniae]
MANFSWFIGVFLGATTYRWLARDEREVQAKAAFAPARWRKSNLPSAAAGRGRLQTGTNLAVYHYSQSVKRRQVR